MTHPPADLGQVLDDAEQALPALFVFGVLPLLGLAGTGALAPLLTALAALYAPPTDLVLSLFWMW